MYSYFLLRCVQSRLIYILTEYMVSITHDAEKDINLAMKGERRRSVPFSSPLSQDQGLIVLYQQLLSPTFSIEHAVQNMLYYSGEKISFLLE